MKKLGVSMLFEKQSNCSVLEHCSVSVSPRTTHSILLARLC